MSKRYVNTYTDPDGIKHYPTPAIDKLTEIDAVDPDLDELIIHDNSQTTGQREKRVKPSKLWPMRARTILGRARSSGGPQVIKPEQMLATEDRAGFMAADDKAIVNLGAGVKNYIINGNFDIWQRGTSFTINVYTADRWLSRGTDVHVEKSAIGIYPAAQVSSTTTEVGIQQKIENGYLLSNQVCTISFDYEYVSGNAGDLLLYINNDGGFKTGLTVAISNPTVTERKTFSVTIPSYAANDYMCVGLGANTTNLVFKIARFQLEAGPVATEFEQRPVGMELALCQRYYWQGKTGVDQGYYTAPSALNSLIGTWQAFPVPMRVTPSGSVSGELYVNCQHRDILRNVNGFVHRVDSSGAGRYIVYDGVYKMDAEL